MTEKILIIPCSGIGKPFGTISRDATFRVVDDLKPNTSETNCLSLLVTGDKKAVKQVQSSKCIAVDGCPLECARKNIEIVGVKPSAHIRVMDLLKENRGLKPQKTSFLDEDGEKLSIILSNKIATKVDELQEDCS